MFSQALAATVSGGSVAAITSSTVTPGASLDEHQAVGGDVDHGQVGDDPVDHAAAGQRQRALVHDLRRAVLGDVLHQHDHALGAVHQVHRAARAP